MSYYRRGGPGFGSLGGMMTSGVQMLLIANVAVFVLQRIAGPTFWGVFGLVPQFAVGRLMLWQFVTYMFLHGSLTHIFFNMFALWMFGTEIERYWGRSQFLKYYFITGIGGGLLTWVFSINSLVPTVGASAAVLGLIVAYGTMFPDRYVFVSFVIPMKAKYVVILFAALEIYALPRAHTSGIAHFAHLGGIAFGYLYLNQGRLQMRWQRWQGSRREKKRAKVVRVQNTRVRQREKAVDEILEKINQTGIDSLTQREREILERESTRRKRQ